MSGDGRRSFVDGISVGVLTRIFHRDLVDDVLVETGRGGQRVRLLPGRVVVYYVLALVLFYGDAYEEVMRKLVDGLKYLGSWGSRWQVPSDAAISKARQRVGEDPFRALFERVATPMARASTPGAWLHGLRLMAVDGVVLDVPDVAENVAEFGKSIHATGTSPFPQVRMVGLGECGTHAIVAAHFDGHAAHERELLRGILDDFAPDMLVLADRGFYSYDMFTAARATEAHLLWRLSDTLELPVLEWLPDGSYRSEIVPPRTKKITEDDRIPVRVVEYMITNRGDNTELFRLITSLTDHHTHPAIDLAQAYAQRWEFELLLDELEVHQVAGHRILRSRKPELIRQEIWALLLTHYALRTFMLDASEDIEKTGHEPFDPTRISFIRTLRAVRRQIPRQAGFSPSPPDHSNPRNPPRNP